MGKNNKKKFNKPTEVKKPETNAVSTQTENSAPKKPEVKQPEKPQATKQPVKPVVQTPKKPVTPPTPVTTVEAQTVESAAEIVNKGVNSADISLDVIAMVTKNLTDRYVNHPVAGQKEELIESMTGAGGIIDLFNVECVARILKSGKMITLENVKNSEAYAAFQKTCGFFGVTLPDQKMLASPKEGVLEFKDGENGVVVSEETKEIINQEEAREKKTKEELTVENTTDDNLDLALQRVWDKEKTKSLGNGFVKVIEFIQTYDHNHATTDEDRNTVDNRTVTDIIDRIYTAIPKGMLLFDALGKMLISLIKADKNPITAFLSLKGQMRIVDDVNSVKDDSGDYVKTVYVYPFKDKEIAQIIIALVDHTLNGMAESFDRMINKAEEIKENDPGFAGKEARIAGIKSLKDSYSGIYDAMTMMKESDINAMKDNRDEIIASKGNAEKKAELEQKSKTFFVVAGNYNLSSKDPETKKTIVKDPATVREISKYIANLFRAVDCQMPTDFVLTAKVTEVKN